MVIQYFCKFINTFHKDQFKKLLALLFLINTTFLIAKPIIKFKDSITKQKRSQLIKTNNSNKHIKNSRVFDFYLIFDLFFSKTINLLLIIWFQKLIFILVLFFRFFVLKLLLN